MTALPPAGWYPDPDAGGTRWRWWDGGQWWPTTFGYDGAAAVLTLETSRNATQKYGNWLRWAMAANAAASLIVSAGFAFIVHSKGFHFFSTDSAGVVHFSNRLVVLELVELPLSFASLAAVGSLIAWIFQAGRFAEASGWPATRGRQLGAFSVLIPLVNFWWPYEAVRDAFPPGSSPPVVLRWWLSYLAVPFLAPALAIIAGFTATTGVVWVVVVVDAFLLMVPVRFGWQVIRHMASAQRQGSASLS